MDKQDRDFRVGEYCSMAKVSPWELLATISSTPPPPQGAACWLRAAWPRDARPLGAQPLPQVLEPAASKAADVTAFDHAGTTPSVCATDREKPSA